mgnify:FL=1
MTGGAISENAVKNINEAAIHVKDLTASLGKDNEDTSKMTAADSLQKVVDALKVGQESFPEISQNDAQQEQQQQHQPGNGDEAQEVDDETKVEEQEQEQEGKEEAEEQNFVDGSLTF